MIIGPLEFEASEDAVKALLPASGVAGFAPTPTPPPRAGIVRSVIIELTLKKAAGQRQHLLADSGL